MKIDLKPIRPKSIPDQVFDQLRELIFRGDYQPGQKIMTERELADALNVGRNSVREAINKLVALRLVEQRQGQGTFVRSFDEAVQIPLATVMETQDATLIDLLEMCMCIECTAASLAAQRINATGLDAIAKAIDEMERDIGFGGLGTEGDLAFHTAIAAAAQNPLQICIMKHVSDFLHVSSRKRLLHLYQDSQNIATIIKQHKAIFDAIRLREPDVAYNAMRTHITFVIEFFSIRQLSMA